MCGSEVDHVFFRNKGEIHTTRSRWLVGLVIDFKTYEHYLLYTNRTLNETLHTINQGKYYFESEYEKYNAKGVEHNRISVLRQYCQIIGAQLRELIILSELHDKNWLDFLELRKVGHSELEQSRIHNTEGLRGKRALGLLAGIFSGIAVWRTEQLRTEVNKLQQNQVVIHNALKESISLINLTRMEVQENRLAINKVIGGMTSMVKSWNLVVDHMSKFIVASEQAQANLNMVQSLISAESNMIAELHSKIAKLATKKLSPTILPAPDLVKVLKNIEVEIPPALMLPQDPRERPFYYYTVLSTNTLALDDKLIITVEIPLLDVSRKLNLKEAITLPVPYQNTNLTAQYDLEFHHFGITEDGRQYVILGLEDQLSCSKQAIGYCSLTSAVEETNQHRYCTLSLYQRDAKKIKELCKVKVTNKLKLPIARYVSEGEWLVATEKSFKMRKKCVGVEREIHLSVTAPYTVVKLDSGCRALSDLLELPIYFEQRTEYQVYRETRITTPPKSLKLANLTIWRPIANIELGAEIDNLGPIENVPIEQLISRVEEVKFNKTFSWYKVLYIVLAILVLFIVVTIGIACCKRKVILRMVATRIIGYLGNDIVMTEIRDNSDDDKSDIINQSAQTDINKSAHTALLTASMPAPMSALKSSTSKQSSASDNRFGWLGKSRPQRTTITIGKRTR